MIRKIIFGFIWFIVLLLSSMRVVVFYTFSSPKEELLADFVKHIR